MMHGVFGVSRDDRRLRNDGGGRNVVVRRLDPEAFWVDSVDPSVVNPLKWTRTARSTLENDRNN